MKPWDRGAHLDREVEAFTVGLDPSLDRYLLPYDCLASIAHAQMLADAGILTIDELWRIKDALVSIRNEALLGKISIAVEDTDGHSVIERLLSERLGETGGKVLTARSRSDQVQAALRLYTRDKLVDLADLTRALVKNLIDKARAHEHVPMPGYSQGRLEALSSVGLLFAAYAESLVDGLRVLWCAHDLTNQCPLGSASGYGVPLDIDRDQVAQLLGFPRLQRNTLYVQNSRGRLEGEAIHAAWVIASDCARMAEDLILFTMDEFGFFALPDEFTVGSSIRPDRRSADVLEVIRARALRIRNDESYLNTLTLRLMSGYHRDLQHTKGPLIYGLEGALRVVKMSAMVVDVLTVDEERCRAAITDKLLATDAVYERIREGEPFPKAYMEVSITGAPPEETDPDTLLALRGGVGMPGNLGLGGIDLDLAVAAGRVEKERQLTTATYQRLLET